ncbi:MAG TPA: AAA family ATPase, partial [Thermopolyspora sp.]
MVGRSVSPVFVGRQAELRALCEAFQQAHERGASTVLVGGEAGVGKTRLVARFAEQAASTEARVLCGGCVELSAEGLAYAPFTAALRQLVRETGADEITALLPQGASRDLARLLPEFGEVNGDRETETARARLFEQFLTLLERLAEQRPLILVIEDIHWADRSSRDLIAFLSRNLLVPQVLMVLTYRSDELHRQHPLRPVLAQLGRIEGVLRLDLPRFTRDEVAAQMAGILGTTPEFTNVNNVYERSEGIPLFVEAMVDCGQDCAVPASLHDLISGTFESLPEKTQQVLRVAAAGGTRVGHDLLAAATQLSDTKLEDALRPAIAAKVIQIADGRAYAFRHSLIREVVHDELLPGEHIRLHACYAKEIERDRSLVPPGRAAIEIAHHWYSARDDLCALISAWEAADQAAKTFAYTEQIQLLERVLSLWCKVPDAAERIGADHATVLEHATEAASACGEIDRGTRYVNAALDALDEEHDAERVARLLVRRSWLKAEKGKPGALDDLRRAEKLVPLPGATRGHVLERLSRHIMFSDDVTEGIALVQEALRIARDLGDESLEVDLLLSLAIGQSIGGDLEGSLATTLRAGEIGERIRLGQQVLRALANTMDTLNNLGRSAEAVELSVKGEALAREYGRYRVAGVFIVNNRAEALEALGRWDEAEQAIDQALRMDTSVRNRRHLLRVRAEIALRRGDTDLAEQTLTEVGALHRQGDMFPQETLTFTQEMLTNARLEVAWHLLRGDPVVAIDAAARIQSTHAISSKAMLGWRLIVEICAACDAAATIAPERAAAVRIAVDDLVSEMIVDGPACAAFRLMHARDYDGAAAAW